MKLWQMLLDVPRPRFVQGIPFQILRVRLLQVGRPYVQHNPEQVDRLLYLNQAFAQPHPQL